ncbi:MAG TPA: hypothetical protein VF329_09670 [Gammaproteobacteria bacterium]
MPDDDLQPLVERLAASTPLSREQARRVVLDVIAYLTESPEAYVARRHRELKRSEGLRNDAIFERLADELRCRVFAMPPLTTRQIRRMIYG